MSGLTPLDDNRPIQSNKNPISKEEKITDQLPKKLILKALSYLDPQELQEKRLVSKDLNTVIVSEIKSEYTKINSFADFLAKNLPDSYSDQKKEFSALAKTTNPEIPIDLKQVQAISKLKKSFIDILTKLKTGDLNVLKKSSLQNINTPQSFENIFDLVDIAIVINGNFITEEDLDNYTKLLKKDLESNNLTELMELVDLISDREFKSAILNDIIHELMTNLDDDNRKKTMQILSMISDTEIKDALLIGTFNELTVLNPPFATDPTMIQMAKMLSSDEWKAECLRDISGQYARTGDFDNALEIAKQIPILDIKELTLRVINTSSLSQGKIDESLKIMKVLDELRAENNLTE